jgi:hypothetical protein
MKEFKVSITTEHVFSKEEIADLIVTALEGGINYWCRKAVMKENAITKDYFNVLPEDQDKINYASDLISYGGTLILFDAESSDKWELDIDKMLKGIDMHCTNMKKSPANLMDDYDANDADAIVQYAVFGELVFG